MVLACVFVRYAVFAAVLASKKKSIPQGRISAKGSKREYSKAEYETALTHVQQLYRAIIAIQCSKDIIL